VSQVQPAGEVAHLVSHIKGMEDHARMAVGPPFERISKYSVLIYPITSLYSKQSIQMTILQCPSNHSGTFLTTFWSRVSKKEK